MTNIPLRIKKSKLFVALCLGIGVTCLCVSAFVAWLAVDEVVYPNVFGLGFSVLIFALSIYSFGYIYLSGDLLIYDDRIEIYTIHGRLYNTITLSEVEKWYELENEKSAKIKIIHSGKTYTISKQELGYAEVKQCMLSLDEKNGAVSNDSEYAQIRRYRREAAYTSIALTMLSAILLWGGYSELKGQYIEPQGFVYLKDVVTKKHKGKGCRFTFMLAGHPSFRFSEDDCALFDMVVVGDSIEIGIDSAAYKKKITRQETPAFWEKYINYSFIHPTEIIVGESAYLDPQYVKGGDDGDKQVGAMLMTMGAIILLVVVWLVFRLRSGDTMESVVKMKFKRFF